MQIYKVISEHKKTKRKAIMGMSKDGERTFQIDGSKFHSKVGFIEAIVKEPGGYLHTAHISDPRPKKDK